MVSRHSPFRPLRASQQDADGSRSGRQVQLVGRRLRRLRKDHRLTVDELAARVGLQSTDLTRLEKGEYRVSLDVLFRLLAALATSVESFFADVARELAQSADSEVLREL